MTHLQTLVSGSLICLLTVSIVAQSAPQGLEGIFPTPIHTAGTDPEFGPYGHWVAGADYKASFGREFTFYPARGPSSASSSRSSPASPASSTPSSARCGRRRG